MLGLLPALLLGSAAAQTPAVAVTWRPDGTALLCSAHIRAWVPAVPGLRLPPDEAAREALRAKIRAERDADDLRTYGLHTAEIRAQAQQTPRGEPYLDSEQHQVFAALASARTGGQLSADFFAEIDPFGGTAGNGPLIQPGGGAGQLLSTIGLVHDADWLIGRHLAAGPLAALAGLPEADPRYLGLVGLTDSRRAARWARADGLNPFFRGPDPGERAALDSLGGRVYLGPAGDARFQLNPDNPAGVWVQFREDYIRQHNRGRLDSPTPLPWRRHARFAEAVLWPANQPCAPGAAPTGADVHA